MRKILLIVLAAFALASCNKDNGDGEGNKGGQITLPKQSEKTQQAFADEETSGGFTFTAKSSWTANVTQTGGVSASAVAAYSATLTRAGGLSWLRLLLNGTETYSGGAGSFTLAIELDPNYTGETRTATITITCGTETITITVTQQGKTQEGEVPEEPNQKKPDITGITLDRQTLELTVGATDSLTATVAPFDTEGNMRVHWESDSRLVAGVDVTGKVTALSAGVAIITATSRSNPAITASCTVTVTTALSLETLSFVAEGESKTFTVNTNASFIATSDQTGWCTVAVSGTTVTVTTNVNTTNSPRTATITVKTSSGSSEQTNTVAVSQAASVASRFARSNIVLKDGKLTFAVTEADNATIPADVQGLFFKFGSLIAVNGGNTADFTASDVVFAPPGYTLNITNTADVAWAGVPYCYYTEATGVDVDAMVAAYPTTGYSVSEGKGDICRYITDQGWVQGRWRTPKASEFQALYNETTQKTNDIYQYRGLSVGTWLTAPTIAGTDGTSRLTMGWFIGSGVKPSTSATNAPPVNTVFFPASGKRDYSSGAFSVAGSNSYNWSAAPSGYNGFALEFNSTSISLSGSNNRAYGFPIRCILE